MASSSEYLSSSDDADVLREVFGYTEFRPGQRESIAEFRAGRDVLVVLPTGGGKSICYQVPAVLWSREGHGTTLVISPLIALMDDQVASLQGRGVPAAALHSAQHADDNDLVIDAFERGSLNLLYVSPERLLSPRFGASLEHAQVAAVAVDEAHCISQWGHDFRPEYSRIAEVTQRFRCPTMALTATATARVADEIVSTLGLSAPHYYRGSFLRSNLSFRVERGLSEDERLVRLASEVRPIAAARGAAGRALIYAATRKRVEAIAAGLASHGVTAAAYHAGKSERVRERIQGAYARGGISVLVATNAFGMGVDQPDVRVVVHAQAPASLEAYYQEAGRAGRDGLPALALLLDADRDRALQRRLQGSGHSMPTRRRFQDSALAELDAYARAEFGCRQQIISAYFGDELTAPCGCCDLCVGDAVIAMKPGPRARASDDSTVRETILRAADHLSRPVGQGALARALRGSKAKDIRRHGLQRLPEYGALGGIGEAELVATIEALLDLGELERRGVKYPTVWRTGRPVRRARSTTSRGRRRAERKSAGLRGELVSYRRRQARALNWKLYMVFTNDVIDAIEASCPESLGDLEKIRGLGPSKIERFGIDLVELIARHR